MVNITELHEGAMFDIPTNNSLGVMSLFSLVLAMFAAALSRKSARDLARSRRMVEMEGRIPNGSAK